MILSNFPGGGAVTGVKGNAEEAFRKGKVNITPENIGAYSKEEIDARLGTTVVDHTVYMSAMYSVSGHTITYNNS